MPKALLKNIATLGFVGYLPFAQGTWGTLVSLLFVYFLKPGFLPLLLCIPVFTIIGVISAQYAEIHFKEKDSRRIVIDEFIGYLVTVVMVPLSIPYILAAFVLFRFFDIFKPPPIRKIEKILLGGYGIVADDLLAGVYANLCLQIWIILRN